MQIYAQKLYIKTLHQMIDFQQVYDSWSLNCSYRWSSFMQIYAQKLYIQRLKFLISDLWINQTDDQALDRSRSLYIWLHLNKFLISDFWIVHTDDQASCRYMPRSYIYRDSTSNNWSSTSFWFLTSESIKQMIKL